MTDAEIALRIVTKIAGCGRVCWDAWYIDAPVDLAADELALLERLYASAVPEP